MWRRAWRTQNLSRGMRGLCSHITTVLVTCGLRDYGTASWDGGDPECDHLAGALCSDKSTLAGFTSENIKLRTNGMPFKDVCRKCGAIRIDQQIGLEPTPEEYVAQLVAVFAEVRRVLKPGGTLWLNLGDTYATSGRGGGGGSIPWDDQAVGTSISEANHRRNPVKRPLRGLATTTAPGYKPKDLVGIPGDVARALRADGWYWRQEIIWAKPNPMPESVTDRCTKSHEYIQLMSKSARYYYDAAAIAEPSCDPLGSAARYKSAFGGSKNEALLASGQVHTRPIGNREFDGTRNARDVWTIATHPYSGAHFATFPPELPRRCILAGCPPGGVVLDPFFGSGTTGMVAESLARKWIGIELNPQYIELARKRTAQRGLFAEAQIA